MTTTVILGMHRSGTSIVTRLIHLMGLSLGPTDHLIPPARDNPKGFWENSTIIRINDGLLNAFGGHWYAPPDFPPEWWQTPELEQLREKASQYLQQSFDAPDWACKDPRLCLTLPFWQQCISNNIVVVFVHRSPLEIANSLRTRNGFPPMVSVALWEAYALRSLQAAVGLPVMTVGFDDVLQETADVAVSLLQFLEGHGVAGLRTLTDDELAQVVDPGMRHSKHTTQEANSSAWLFEEQRGLLDYVAELPEQSDRFAPDQLPKQSQGGAALVRVFGAAYARTFRLERTIREISKVLDRSAGVSDAARIAKIQRILQSR